MAKDIGIDLGASRIQIFVRGKGVVIDEPAITALDKSTGEVIQIGKDASILAERTPGNVDLVYPLRNTAINRYETMLKLFRHYFSLIKVPRRPRVLLSIPCGISEAEERVYIGSAVQAGARSVYLIDKAAAAAVGADIDIDLPQGNLVVDIGAASTELAVLSLGISVLSDSSPICGISFDETIMRYIQDEYGIIITPEDAEELKKRIGCLSEELTANREMDVTGITISEGLPITLTITAEELVPVLREVAYDIADVILDLADRIPAELAPDIDAGGITLTGGGCMMPGIEELIAEAVGLPVRIADNAPSCVILGVGKYLERLDNIREGLINLSRPSQDYAN